MSLDIFCWQRKTELRLPSFPWEWDRDSLRCARRITAWCASSFAVRSCLRKERTGSILRSIPGSCFQSVAPVPWLVRTWRMIPRTPLTARVSGRDFPLSLRDRSLTLCWRLYSRSLSLAMPESICRRFSRTAGSCSRYQGGRYGQEHRWTQDLHRA